MIEINLVPDVKQELIKAQRMRTSVVSLAIVTSIVAAGVVVLLAVWVFAVQTVRMAANDGAIKTEFEKLEARPDLDKVLTIQNQLKQLSDLNSSKLMDSRIFDVLAAILPPAPNDVQISDLLINSDESSITIQGQAANSYQALEVFKKTVANARFTYGDLSKEEAIPLASEVTTTDVTYGEDSSGTRVLRFTLKFFYPPEIFSPASTGIKLFKGIDGNVTDSYLGLPQNVFADRAADETGGQ